MDEQANGLISKQPFFKSALANERMASKAGSDSEDSIASSSRSTRSDDLRAGRRKSVKVRTRIAHLSSGYQLFSKMSWAEAKKQFPKAGFTQLRSVVGKWWTGLSEDEKAVCFLNESVALNICQRAMPRMSRMQN